MAYVPYAYALVTGVGDQVPLEHTRPGAYLWRDRFSVVRSRPGCAIAFAASAGSSCSQILTTTQTRRRELGCRCHGRGGRCHGPRSFRRHQLVLGLGRWLWSGQVCQELSSTNAAILAPRSKMSTRRRRFPTRPAPSMPPSSGAASVDDARHRHDLTGRLRNYRLRDARRCGRRCGSGSGRARRHLSRVPRT
jgi:hypothetical protein